MRLWLMRRRIEVKAIAGGGGRDESDRGVSRRRRAISEYAAAMASGSPEMLRTRSWTPGTTLETPALQLATARTLAIVAPALPMIMPASLVETRARRVSSSGTELTWWSTGDEGEAMSCVSYASAGRKVPGRKVRRVDSRRAPGFTALTRVGHF
jgi:hypothetical protein